ncbi:hypothetical protein ACFVBM_22615 [Streptomyces griseus]|uniref:hypothetical protein n=1 Tax=Streptomyces griseus TaxID=1911 RepID=UPI0036AEEC25
MAFTTQVTNWLRNAARLSLCALTGAVLTLGGSTPASAAEPQSATVTYDRDVSTVTGNGYSVSITATVTRNGDRYTLEATVKSTCFHRNGPDQKWGLAFGSSAEKWRYAEGKCGDNAQRTDRISETGPLRPDGRVYLQAGAYGGEAFGSWGWGTARSVWV